MRPRSPTRPAARPSPATMHSCFVYRCNGSVDHFRDVRVDLTMEDVLISNADEVVASYPRRDIYLVSARPITPPVMF